MKVGKVRAGKDHAVHEILHFLVVPLLNVRYLPLVTKPRSMLAQKKMECLGVALTKYLPESRLVGLVTWSDHPRQLAFQR